MSDHWREYPPGGNDPQAGAPGPWSPEVPPLSQSIHDMPDSSWYPGQQAPQQHPYQPQPLGQQGQPGPYEWNEQGRAPQPYPPQQPGPRQPDSGPARPPQSEPADTVAASATDAAPDAEHPPIPRAGTQAGAGRAAMRKAARGRRRRPLRIAAWSALGAVLLGAGYGGYQYVSLDNKLHGSALHAQGDDTASAPKEIVDSFGRSPINILVIGSDSRGTSSDCKYGGATCGSAGGQRADVEMILHVAADRSNATVMSIPRDLYVQLPACAGGGSNKINSALLDSPGCQVDAVERLTRIPIDHFIEVDFSGVVAVSNAIGGVPVCVSSDVYDRNSGLKLSKGRHNLEGQAALQFVRTRDAFNDGSDVDRTDTQHAFLSAALNQLEASGTASNPTKVLSLTSSVLGSLTVDDPIKSPLKLASLAWDIHKVPSKRITFVTMQTGTDTDKNLVRAAGATALFHAIATDESLSKITALSPASASASPPAKGGASSSPKASAKPTPTATQGKADTQSLDGAHHQSAASTKGCAGAPVGNVENIPVGLTMQYTAAGRRALDTPEPGTDHHRMYCGIGPSGTNCYATPDAAYALFPKVENSAP